MSQQEPPSMEEKARHQRRNTEHSATTQSTVQSASSRVEENIMNPSFQAQLEEADLDSDEFPWIEDELGPELSGSHITGNRDPEEYEREVKWLDANKAERIIAEKNPGRLLRQNPSMLKLAQQPNQRMVDDENIEEPMVRSKDRRAVRSGMEVVTNRKALSAGMSGLDATTTATAETRHMTNESEESSGLRERAKSLYGH